MELLCIMIAVGLVYFPAVWAGNKIAGEKGIVFVMSLLIGLSALFMIALPILCYCFLRFVLPTL